MFRSSLLLVVAAAVIQPSAAEAGDFRHGKVVPHFAVPYVAVPQIVLPHIAVPNIAVSKIAVPHFSGPFVPTPRQSDFTRHGFKHHGTYLQWQANRRLLGNPVGIETSVFSSRTQGSWMRFEYGYIVRYATGRTFIVRGGIGQAWIENGGVYGRLGFPKGNEFEFNSQGHDAQVFERGLVFWNPTLGRFVVGPNGSKI